VRFLKTELEVVFKEMRMWGEDRRRIERVLRDRRRGESGEEEESEEEEEERIGEVIRSIVVVVITDETWGGRRRGEKFKCRRAWDRTVRREEMAERRLCWRDFSGLVLVLVLVLVEEVFSARRIFVEGESRVELLFTDDVSLLPPLLLLLLLLPCSMGDLNRIENTIKRYDKISPTEPSMDITWNGV